MSKELRIIPIGGLGEFGMHMTVFESGDDIVLVDAGVLFPSDNHFGVDKIVPDLSYVLANKDKLRGLVLTHGHMDHIGAVPHVLEQLDVPVYGTAFTLGLVRRQLSEATLVRPASLNTIKPGDRIDLGCFGIEPIHVTHSTAQCVALAIETPMGHVIHTGDFKVDRTPVAGPPFDDEALAGYGRRGVLLLMSDSTNSDVQGSSSSEREVGPVLDRMFEEAEQAIFFTCFSTAIHRVQQIVDRAVTHRRKVALVGRSLVETCDIAARQGLFKMPPGTEVNHRDIETYPRHDRVTIIAGSQGEYRSSMTRAARGQHNTARIDEGDTVAFSSKIIPGNERPIFRVINNLYRLGAEVLYEANRPGLHSSGHPCQEELRLMLDLVRPRYFLPIHGELRQLAQHRQLARDARGTDLQDSFLIENGSVLHFDEAGCRVLEDGVPVGRTMIDAGTRSPIDQDGAMRERRRLSDFGVLVPVVTVDERKGRATDIEILNRGFEVSAGSRAMLDGAKDAIRKTVRRSRRSERSDPEQMENRIERELRRYISRKTSRQSRPVIVPVLLDH